MFYIRVILIFTWVALSCTVGLLMCLVRWGDLNLDRDLGKMVGWGVLKLCGIQVECEGYESINSHQPCIYVANHQSSFDVATFGQICPDRTIIIAKRELVYIPFFGVMFVAAGNIVIDRGNRTKAVAGLSESVKAIKAKNASVIIFPEGTRNRTMRGMLPFKKGAFHMAIEAQVPIVPIVCSSLEPLLDLKNRTIRRGTVRFKVLEPVRTEGLTGKDVESLGLRVRERMLEALRGLETSSVT